jgi:phosphopantothenoylcysteine decarboxylase / phosphopantothenate---cysteine ligase
MILASKNILLGISGGIAAYKCAHLVRLLVKAGAEVKVVMTSAATQFVTPQTLSVLSKNEVTIDFFDANHNWNNHVHLAEWADIMVIAPLTANTLSKMAQGTCDNVLLATYLSAKCPVFVAPAMDLDMYKHGSTKANLFTLERFGNTIIPAESGELASGLSGEGRMAEPENILAAIEQQFIKQLPLNGKHILVNAGPTYEAIDPVRFIGNRSSGKMGIAIAEVLEEYGAKVTLVLGPSSEKINSKTLQVVRVESGEDMFKACLILFKNCDAAICSAAVADYKPETVATQKIKKTSDDFQLNLVKTKDILQELGKVKNHQCLVGFALETVDLEMNAKQKIQKKNLDFIVANHALEKGAGFGVDTNKITIIDKHNNLVNFELKSKQEVAKDIVNYLMTYTKWK